MSVYHWNVTGIGFLTTEVKDAAMRQFVLNHKESILKAQNDYAERVKKLFTELDESSLWNDADAIAKGLKECCENYTLAQFVCTVMNQELGEEAFDWIGMDAYSQEAVMFCPVYPWEMPQKVSALSGDVAKTILNGYAEELEVDSADYLSLSFSD